MYRILIVLNIVGYKPIKDNNATWQQQKSHWQGHLGVIYISSGLQITSIIASNITLAISFS